jgi:hypothetical protein
MVIRVDIARSERIERLASEGAFEDTNQVLDEALDMLENKIKTERLRKLLQHGLESGEPRELTVELIEEIDLQAQRRAHAARTTASDVAS